MCPYQYVVAMALFYFVLALILQSSLTLANEDHEATSREVLTPVSEDEVVHDYNEARTDWMDMFLLTPGHLYPGSLGSSVALMSSATKSNKTAEEQLNDIKEIAKDITLAIQSEMANLLSYALIGCEKEKDAKDVKVEIDVNDYNHENKLRKRRSIETPMDSTKMVMRLLKHIKANNEYQNIAIENMMSAQEIADKYGIEFTPDAEVLSDLAVAANAQTKELSEILQEACDSKNATTNQVKFVPVKEESSEEDSSENNTYFVYNVHPQEIQAAFQQHAPHEYRPEQDHSHHANHHQPGYVHVNQYNPYETQINAPPTQQPQNPHVTPRPDFYDSIGFSPIPDYYQPYCPVEPYTTTTTIILPIEELFEPEPELVGEEYEETVSSKVFVDHEAEPGVSTVNHVMTYTLSEKAHFRTPELEALPQQIQYSFFLM